MKLGFKLGVRFLLSNVGQTILIILGIGVAVSIQIFIGSLISGLQSGLVDKTIGNSSQITILSSRDDGLIRDYKDIVKKIKNEVDPIEVVSSVHDNSSLVALNDDDSKSLLVRGMNYKDSNQIYEWDEAIIKGEYPSKNKEVLLGKNFMEDEGIEIGDKLEITRNDRTTEEVVVSGFFDLKVESLNDSWAITTLSSSWKLFDNKNKVTSIETQLNTDEIFNADLIAADIESLLEDEKIETSNWKDANESLLSGLEGQSISSYMIQVFVMISVILGISSVLAITVMQKSRQIGILKAMGLKNGMASYVFLSQGFILGIIGAIVGILLGVGLGLGFSEFVLNADGTPVVEITIDKGFILFSGLVAVVASLIASLIPAIKSKKLNPIDIIRNN